MRNQFGGHAVKTDAPAGGDQAGSDRAPDQSDAARAADAGSDSAAARARSTPTCTSSTCPCTTSGPTPPSRSRCRRASRRSSGRNGQGKTNLVEAVDYVARLASHRVASDAPLVRSGAEQAVVRAVVVRDGREAVLEVEINPGRSNRARVNRSPLPRARELLGLVRTVLFSPEDLALVKGDPSDRRRFLDDLLVQRAPRFAGVRSDYDRVLRSATPCSRTPASAVVGAPGPTSTSRARSRCGTSSSPRWGPSCSRPGSAWWRTCEPLVGTAYEAVAQSATRADGTEASLTYRPSFDLGALGQPGVVPERAPLRDAILAELARRRADELQRGISLVGPHRDELVLGLGSLPVKGYASHGESWSFALALRLASYDLLRAGGDDPILILDDVFAELDTDRRDRLAELVAGAEQVLVTAAVAADVPDVLRGHRIDIVDGEVAVHGK